MLVALLSKIAGFDKDLHRRGAENAEDRRVKPFGSSIRRGFSAFLGVLRASAVKGLLGNR